MLICVDAIVGKRIIIDKLRGLTDMRKYTKTMNCTDINRTKVEASLSWWISMRLPSRSSLKVRWSPPVARKQSASFSVDH